MSDRANADIPVGRTGTGGGSTVVPPDAEVLLSVENLCFRYGGNEVLKGINLHMEEGEALCLLGPHGGGKTTLLDCQLKINAPASGQIFYGDRNYFRLSGGEPRMVLIARALVQDSPLLIMDEPGSHLDYRNEIMMLETILTLISRKKRSVLILMAGCSGRKSSVVKKTSGGQVVIDSWDREVHIPENVDKVACLYAFTGHVTTMLGRGDDIVAFVPGLKRDRMLNELNPQLENAEVCSLDGEINIEELLKTAPDLVFLKGETAMMDSEVEKLERFSIPYVVIEYNSMKEQMEAVEIIAAVLEREEKGREYVSFYEDVIKKGRKLTKGFGDDERIRVSHSVNEAVRTDAPGTLPAEWLEVCGVENVSVGEDLRFKDNKYFASLEQIYLWDPKVIICNDAGVPGYMMSNEKWAGLQAVRSGKVHQIPIGISRWGHPGGMETPLAILWTIGTLYPDLKEKADLRGGMDEFYSRFFGFVPDEKTVSTILDGSGMRLP